MPTDHPCWELLEQYLLNKASEDEEAAIEEHLLFCSKCINSAEAIARDLVALKTAFQRFTRRAPEVTSASGPHIGPMERFAFVLASACVVGLFVSVTTPLPELTGSITRTDTIALHSEPRSVSSYVRPTVSATDGHLDLSQGKRSARKLTPKRARRDSGVEPAADLMSILSEPSLDGIVLSGPPDLLTQAGTGPSVLRPEFPAAPLRNVRPPHTIRRVVRAAVYPFKKMAKFVARASGPIKNAVRNTAETHQSDRSTADSVNSSLLD